MTDERASTTIGTQTPLPRTCLSFSSLIGNQQHQQESNSKYSPFEQKMLENELRLQTQSNALKNIDRILNDKQIINKSVNDVQSQSLKSSEALTNFEHRYQTANQMVILIEPFNCIFANFQFGIRF